MILIRAGNSVHQCLDALYIPDKDSLDKKDIRERVNLGLPLSLEAAKIWDDFAHIEKYPEFYGLSLELRNMQNRIEQYKQQKDDQTI